jgi:hypothetical protein
MSSFNTGLVHLPSSASTLISDDNTKQNKKNGILSPQWKPQDVLVCQCVCWRQFRASKGTSIHPAGLSQHVIMWYASHIINQSFQIHYDINEVIYNVHEINEYAICKNFGMLVVVVYDTA